MPQIGELRVTNLRDTSFTVSWITTLPRGGQINYGSTPALGSVAYDERGAGFQDDTHHVTVKGLLPSTTYYFDVVCDGLTDDNDGQHYTVTTGPTLGLPKSDTVYGRVLKSDGTTSAEGAIVYVTVVDRDGQGSSGESAPLSGLVDGNGYWSVNLGSARTAEHNASFDYSSSGDDVRLEAQGVADGTASQTVDTADDYPAPDMILGAVSTPTHTPTQTPSPTTTSTPTPTLTPTRTSSPGVTATPTSSPTITLLG